MIPLPRDAATARLFIALWPGSAMRARLAAHRNAWSWPSGTAPVADARLHLTLHFLGAVPRVRLTDLREGLRVPFERFELRLDRAQLWRGGVAVLCPGEEPVALAALRARLGEALIGLGQPADARPFKPHVTLARHAQGATPPAQVAAVGWRVSGYALVESVLRPASGYTVLERYA